MNDLSQLASTWTLAQVEALFALPFNDLMFQAQGAHRQHFDANTVQLSTLLSIKTGGCSEDCGYCSQSARHDTGLEREKLLDVAEVVATAKAAKDAGATRFCMGAAWRGPKDKDLAAVEEMVVAQAREMVRKMAAGSVRASGGCEPQTSGTGGESLRAS
jgi:biotin synthase